MIQRLALAAALVMGSVGTAAEPLVDLAKDTFKDAKAEAGGQSFEFDMGTKRVNWNNARWSVLELAAPKDLSKSAGIRLTVTAARPRSDAGVYIALREADGTWYYHPWACELTQASNTGVAMFEDFTIPDWCNPAPGEFRDENGKLDLDKISAIAIGCVNPLGVGKLAFTVTAAELLPAKSLDTAPVKVEVTGKLLDINGTTALPAGLFGGFNLMKDAHKTYRLAMNRQGWGSFGKPSDDPVTHMMINCYGDRAAACMMVSDAQWKEKLVASATKAAEASKTMQGTHYVEWWNEPYLNWANKNRKMFEPSFFNESEASEGAPVKLKVDGSECPHLKWTQNYDAPLFQWVTPRYSDSGNDRWRRGKDAQGKLSSGLFEPLPWNRGLSAWRAAVAQSSPPRDVKDGEKYTVTVQDAKSGAEKKLEYTAFTPWWVHDETQFTYWSGKGMGRFYNEPMLAAGKALKAANPNVVYIAGWGYRPSEDQWEAFKMNYKPTIDIGHEVIDGIHDHDYGGDAVKMAANYEVVTAYGMSKYNKWLTSWNTETASSTDPQAYPGAEAADKMNAANPAKFTWTARKLMHTLAVCPDKARAFAWFGNRDNPPGGFLSAGGEGVLFTMLKNFRGRIAQVRCDDPFVYAFAAIDGTDAQNPRPADMPQRKELVVVVLNDHITARQIDLTIAPPTGLKFTEMVVRSPKFAADGTVTIEEKTEKPGDLKAKLGPRELLAATIIVEGDVAAKADATRRQYFGDQVVVNVTGDKPVTQKVAIKADELKAAGRAWIRIVTERLGEGEGVVSVNGKDYPLPKAITPENAAWVRQITVPVAELKESNELIFKTQSPTNAGYFLGMASIVIETP